MWYVMQVRTGTEENIRCDFLDMSYDMIDGNRGKEE